MSVEGRGGFTLRGSGTLDAPTINASVHIDNLTLDHELAGALDLEATTKGRDLHLAGHSNSPRGALSLDGTVQMHDDYPANIQLRMDNLDLDALWRSYMHGELTGHSAVAGTLAMQGPLRNPPAWNVTGNFTGVSLDVEYAQLHNQDPVRFTYAQQSWHIEQMHFVVEVPPSPPLRSLHLPPSPQLSRSPKPPSS